MTPEGEPGVSDFGISSGELPGRRAAGRAADRAADSDSDSAGAGSDDPRFALATEVRRIISAMVGLPLEDDELEAATGVISALADRLEGAAGAGRRPRAQPDPVGAAQDFFPTSPVIGYANPLAPPVVVEAVNGELHGTALFDYQYEGPPTCVHGGVIAALFDELLGSANIIADKAGMTGTLTVRYRRPTPLLAPLDVVARFTGMERRKIFSWGGLYHGGALTAEAEGIFIEVRPGRMLDIVTTNARDSESPVVDPEFIRLIQENVRD